MEHETYSDDLENGLDFSWLENKIEENNLIEREICSDCGGTGLDFIGNSGGSCPGCIGGFRFN